ncbi:urease accessory protein UreD [soil metagenome]
MRGMRSRGELGIALGHSARGTEVTHNFQSGCMRMRMLPGNGTAPTGVILNTSGGLAEGDHVTQTVDWGAGTAATLTSQACEKVYRAMDRGAVVNTRLIVGEYARAEWLPQETILFDRARLTRTTDVKLGQGARFLGLEAVVFGRSAMDEQVVTGLLDDRWRIWREGRLIYADALRLDDAVGALMARAALGGGARAIGVIVLAVAAATALLEPVRAALAKVRGMAAASSWNDLLVVRLLAPDGAALRYDLTLALAALRAGQALPRVWGC